MWRKRVREQRLPPVLVIYAPLVGKWLLLDGHVRLQAALDEGVQPRLVGLCAVRPLPAASDEERSKWVEDAERVYSSIEKSRGEREATTTINAWALEEFGQDYVVAPQRVWPALDTSGQ